MNAPMMCTWINAKTHAMLVEAARLDAALRKTKPAKDPPEGVVESVAQRMIRANGGFPVRAVGSISTERFGYFHGKTPGHGPIGRQESEVRRAIFELLQQAERPMTSVEIMDAVDADHTSQVAEMLRYMEKQGRTIRTAVTAEDREAKPSIGHCKWLWEAAQ